MLLFRSTFALLLLGLMLGCTSTHPLLPISAALQAQGPPIGVSDIQANVTALVTQAIERDRDGWMVWVTNIQAHNNPRI